MVLSVTCVARTRTDNGNNLDTDGTCPFGLTAPPLLGPLANNGGATERYQVQITNFGPGVADIRISPKGTLAASGGGGDPSFQVIFKVIVQ